MMSDIEKVLKERISVFESIARKENSQKISRDKLLLHQLLTHHLQESTEVFVQMKD